MSEIHAEIQSKYVPNVYYRNGKPTDVIEEIPFSGDQFTEQRAFN